MRLFFTWTGLLKSDLHPDVITTAISVTGSILIASSETDIFEEGLVRSLLTRDPSGIHLGFQYDNIGENYSSESAFCSLEALAEIVWKAVVLKKKTLVGKLKNKIGILYRKRATQSERERRRDSPFWGGTCNKLLITWVYSPLG